MIQHSTKLRKGQRPDVVAERRKRLQKILNLNAPEIVVIQMAENYLRSFRRSWYGTWEGWKLSHLSHWILWLIDADYRAVCRDTVEERGEFEKQLREALGIPEKR